MIKRLIAIWRLSKFTKDNRVNHIITDEDRIESHAVRSLKKQIRILEEINEKQQETIKHLVATQKMQKGDLTENLISMALPLLMNKINTEQFNNKDKGVIIENKEVAGNKEIDFTDEQIKAIIASNPKLKEHANKFTDEDIKQYVINQIPSISAKSLNTIVTLLRK